jgi:hypothetical protein
MMLAAAALSKAVTFAMLGHSLGVNLAASYGWTLDKFVALWKYVATVGSGRR